MAPSDLEREIGHGNAGLIPWSALGDVEETVPELIGLNAITTYNKMRQDAQIASLLLAFTLPIRRYRWYIDTTPWASSRSTALRISLQSRR
jgi:hypothetical protein